MHPEGEGLHPRLPVEKDMPRARLVFSHVVTLPRSDTAQQIPFPFPAVLPPEFFYCLHGTFFGAFPLRMEKCWVSPSLISTGVCSPALSAPQLPPQLLAEPVLHTELMRHSCLNNVVPLKLQISAPQQLCVVTEINI